MKKIFLGTILSIATLAAVNAQTSFGVHASGILANTEFKNSGVTMKGDSKFGWKAGLVMNAPLAETFAFMPQLNVLAKGTKVENSGEKETLTMTYVEIPLNFAYTSKGLFVGAGPSIGFGIGGTAKYEASGISEESSIKFDGKKDATDGDLHLKALDFGAQFIAGYRLSSGLFLNAHYNLGLSNISPESEGTVKNKYFGFGVGYFFGGGASASK